MESTFCQPFNWCDSRCERCALTVNCPAYLRSEELVEIARAQGKDESDLDVVAEMVGGELQRALDMLAQVAEEEGIDLSAEPEPEPVSLLARRSRAHALALCREVAALARAVEGQRWELARRLRSAVQTVAVKTARVVGFLDAEGRPQRPESWAQDGAPNMLVIEHALGEVDTLVAFIRRSVGGVDLGAVDDARRELDRVLAPWFAILGDEVRLELAEWVAAGRAPSPFSTR